ncbi:MAG: TonB-dependent receptor [Acidobacteria bacterium]|nr:TonB-dependent receptor [Acidobacteriota bacterium]
MRTRLLLTFGIALLLAVTTSGVALAQGAQTGTLVGEVESEGQGLPGVTVTVTSPSLQGERTAFTGDDGTYIIRALPPGEYQVVFELAGMSTVQRTATISLGATSRSDAEMKVASVEETIVVTGEAPNPLENTQISSNMDWVDQVDSLPITRTFDAVADLAPGVTGGVTTPNSGQLSIGGSFGYDNVFLIDGVDVNDNLFGTANALFIEDAIEEQQVMTSGVSAEYGRFSGGVINAITKSGGNDFSGSFRVDRTRQSWRNRTPLEEENDIQLSDADNDIFSATLGGPIVKDYLWFFLAGRQFDTENNTALAVTAVPVNLTQETERREIKLTGTIAQSHTVQGAYTDVTNDNFRRSFSFSATPSTTFSSSLPNELKVLRYSGVLTSTLFGEAQWSEKSFQFKDSGGTSTDIHDSPFLDFATFTHYNAPWFDANDPEDRNNEQLGASLSYFLSSDSAGTHDFKGGWEDFTSINSGGNNQSSTNVSFFAAFATDANGNPILTSDNELIPVFQNGVTTAALWQAVVGARQEIETNSLYVNDKWQLNDHWSFNIGFRYEDVKSNSTGGLVAVDTTNLVPRLAASYDIKGDGKWKVDLTYAQYAGKYQDGQAAATSNVGNPDTIYVYYVGPDGQGRDFEPGFDLNNYVPYAASLPTANKFIESGLKSPTTTEYTLSLGYELPRGGYVKGTYVNRDVDDFIEDFTTLADGFTDVPGVGPTDNEVFRNTSALTRKYEALQVDSHYRITNNWSVYGNYTYQLKNEGNFEGEDTNQPGSNSVFGDYPEITPADRFYPIGNLDGYQQHKLRLWTAYNFDFGRAGNLNTGLIYSFDSGRAYDEADENFRATAGQRAVARNLGYQNFPGTRTLFFCRGCRNFEDTSVFDLAVTYSFPVWKLEPWVKLELRNIFDSVSVIDGQTSVRSIASSADPNDPLQLPTAFDEGNLGEPTDPVADFNTPQEFRISVGIRF